MTLSFLQRISARLGQLSLAVPASARDDAKLALLHNLTVAFAARTLSIPGELPSNEPARSAGPALLLRDGSHVATHRAVIGNSLLMGARAQHDEHPGSVAHFGSVVIPALLALADTGDLADGERSGGARLLDAMVLGYQAGAALASVVGPRSTPRGFRPTGLFGPFGGAVANGIARQSTEPELAGSLAFALSGASSFTQVWRDGSDEWRFQTAFAARCGFEASEIARHGAIGAAHALEGRSGFLRSFGGFEPDDCDAAAAEVLGRLDDDWAIGQLLLKPYPVCAINQAATWQALQLIEQHALEAAQVDRVHVRLSPADADYPGIAYSGAPTSWAQAMMSLPHAIATAVVERTVSFNDLVPPYPAAVTGLAKRVSVLADDGIGGGHAATVEFLLRDGSIVGTDAPATVPSGWSATADLGTRLGPEHGLGDDGLRSLTEAVRTVDFPGGLQKLRSVLAELTRVSPPSATPSRSSRIT